MENGILPAARAARSWIESSLPPRNHPLLLPRVLASGANQVTFWYAITFSEAQSEELREHLSAFVGPAGSDYSGMRAELDLSDSAESSLAKWVGGSRVYKFSVLPGRQKVVRTALNRLQTVWRLSPSVEMVAIRTTEGILREFFLALVNQDELGAIKWHQDLRVGGRLSAENLVFLEIERLGAFERWHELAAMPQMAFLLVMQRPRNITALLIEALWRTELEDRAITGSVEEVAAYFQANFYPRYHSLLRVRGVLSRVPVILTFLLSAVTANPPRLEQIQPLLDALPTCSQRSIAEAIAALAYIPTATLPKHQTPLELAREAFDNDDYDTAWLHLQSIPAEVESCALMLECAYEIQTKVAAEAVNECMAALSPEFMNLVLNSHRRRRAWDDLKKMIESDNSPSDWEAWFDRNDSCPQWPQLLSTARDAHSEWQISNYLSNPNRVRLLADRLLSDRSKAAKSTLQLAFPHLLGYFLPNGIGAPVFLPLYKDMLLLLGLSDGLSSEDWISTQTLLIAILDSGCDGKSYEDTVNVLKEMWESFGSPTRFDWALDTLDLLAAYPGTQPKARDSLFDSVLASFSKNHRRVSQNHWEIFKWLANDLQRDDDYNAIRPTTELAVPSEKESTNLKGKVVAIYTLTESAGARAQEIIEKLFDGVKVKLSHDLGGSDRLKSLAREADYFIVATRSAKHAATEFLKDSRPRDKSHLIYPSGKGSSSIVSSLLVAVKSEPAA